MLSADLNDRLQRLSQLTKQRFRKKPVLGILSLGGRTPEDVRKEIIALNARIESGAAKPIEKLDVLRHDILFQEIAVLRTILSDALQDADDKTKRVLEVDIGWLDTFREDVHKHQIHCERNEATDETARIENTILTEYEQRKLTMTHNIETIVNQSRRGFMKLATGLAAAAALGFAGQVYAQDEKQQGGVAKTAFESKKTPALTEKNITDLMKYDSVSGILKEKEIIPATLDFVTYDAEKKVTNFDALVYQNALKQEERKPVLVFFYANKPKENVSNDASARDAIIFKKLAMDFGEHIKFVAYDGDVDPAKAADNYAGLFKMNILSLPSIAMYVTYDVLKGETATKNSGEVKLVDVLRGGPDENKYIQGAINNSTNYWIATNILLKQSPKKDGQVYRHGNAWKIQPAGNAELAVK